MKLNLKSFFWLLCEAGRIFVPPPGIEPVPPASEAQSQRIPEFNFHYPTSCLYQMGKWRELQEEDSKSSGDFGDESGQIRKLMGLDSVELCSQK